MDANNWLVLLVFYVLSVVILAYLLARCYRDNRLQQLGGAITVGDGPAATYRPAEFVALYPLLRQQGVTFGNGTGVDARSVRFLEIEVTEEGRTSNILLVGDADGPWWMAPFTADGQVNGRVDTFGTTAPTRDAWSLYFPAERNSTLQVDLYTKVVKRIDAAGNTQSIGTVLRAANALDLSSLKSISPTGAIPAAGFDASGAQIGVAVGGPDKGSIGVTPVALGGPNSGVGVSTGGIPDNSYPQLQRLQEKCPSICQKLVDTYQTMLL